VEAAPAVDHRPTASLRDVPLGAAVEADDHVDELPCTVDDSRLGPACAVTLWTGNTDSRGLIEGDI